MSVCVLLVMNDFPPRDGEIESYPRDSCARLDPENLVALAFLRAPEEKLRAYDESPPYRIHRMRGSVLLPLPHAARRAVQIIRTECIDIVRFGVVAPLGLLDDTCRHAGATRIVIITHGHEVDWSILPLARQILGRIGKSPDVMTYISRYTRDRFAAASGLQTVFEHLPPGVDIERLSPDPEAGQKIWQHHGIGKSQPLIVCTPRLVRRKEQDMLTHSMPKVLEQRSGARLLIVGAGPLNRGLEKLVAKLGVSEQVIFAGKVSCADLPTYYNAASVFAMPAQTRGCGLDVEGLGIVYLEAQVCDVPVITGRSGGTPETVIDDETGIVADGALKHNIATGLVEVLDDPERVAVMGACGREHVVQSWTWEVMATRVRRTFRICVVPL